MTGAFTFADKEHVRIANKASLYTQAEEAFPVTGLPATGIDNAHRDDAPGHSGFTDNIRGMFDYGGDKFFPQLYHRLVRYCLYPGVKNFNPGQRIRGRQFKPGRGSEPGGFQGGGNEVFRITQPGGRGIANTAVFDYAQRHARLLPGLEMLQPVSLKMNAGFFRRSEKYFRIFGRLNGT